MVGQSYGRPVWEGGEPGKGAEVLVARMKYPGSHERMISSFFHFQ